MTESNVSPGRGSAIGPLRGVRVLDLTRMPPGAYCTVGLADLGADVIRIESPRAAGRPSRVVGQSSLARGKRSVTLDLRNERASEVLSRIAGSVDVLVENDPPGELERRGFGYPQAAEQHPRLIWCSITGFGQEGPYAAWPGHDLTYLAQSGLLGALSPIDPEQPWHPSWMLAVPMGASFAMTGILAALRERDATGRGCWIDVSLAEAASWALGGFDAALSDQGVAVPIDPWRRIYACGDAKWVSVAAAEPRTWQRLCEGLGLPELVGELTSPDCDRAAVTQQLSDRFASRPAADWLAELGPQGAAVSPVNVGGDVVRDPHNQARGGTLEVDGVRVPANPIRMRDPSGARSATASQPPALAGEDTDAVLAEAGYAADEIRSLRDAGIL